VNGNSGSIVSPSVPRLKNLPALAGETDILKSLTLLPGISTGLEGTANLQIRGGNPSQTHILLDGVTLYNSNHLGGFLSSIDPYGVKNLTVYKGGIPARYGGRLSGVLDIDLREGRKDKHTEEFFIGTATLRAGREGPLGKRGSYVASGRYSYPTLILNALGIGNYKKGPPATAA
jgi:outer membrane receptor protein involved in Fe transport